MLRRMHDVQATIPDKIESIRTGRSEALNTGAYQFPTMAEERMCTHGDELDEKRLRFHDSVSAAQAAWNVGPMHIPDISQLSELQTNLWSPKSGEISPPTMDSTGMRHQSSAVGSSASSGMSVPLRGQNEKMPVSCSPFESTISMPKPPDCTSLQQPPIEPFAHPAFGHRGTPRIDTPLYSCPGGENTQDSERFVAMSQAAFETQQLPAFNSPFATNMPGDLKLSEHEALLAQIQNVTLDNKGQHIPSAQVLPGGDIIGDASAIRVDKQSVPQPLATNLVHRVEPTQPVPLTRVSPAGQSFAAPSTMPPMMGVEQPVPPSSAMHEKYQAREHVRLALGEYHSAAAHVTTAKTPVEIEEAIARSQKATDVLQRVVAEARRLDAATQAGEAFNMAGSEPVDSTTMAYLAAASQGTMYGGWQEFTARPQMGHAGSKLSPPMPEVATTKVPEQHAYQQPFIYVPRSHAATQMRSGLSNEETTILPGPPVSLPVEQYPNAYSGAVPMSRSMIPGQPDSLAAWNPAMASQMGQAWQPNAQAMMNAASQAMVPLMGQVPPGHLERLRKVSPTIEDSSQYSSDMFSQSADMTRVSDPSMSAKFQSTTKIVCSSGGTFIRSESGLWDYEGGETRLLSIPNQCTGDILFSVLERSTYHSSISSDTPRDMMPIIKYRLPSDPSIMVDLVDDEDVALMFDELKEVTAIIQMSEMAGSETMDASLPTKTSGRLRRTIPKLHIYVQRGSMGKFRNDSLGSLFESCDGADHEKTSCEKEVSQEKASKGMDLDHDNVKNKFSENEPNKGSHGSNVGEDETAVSDKDMVLAKGSNGDDKGTKEQGSGGSESIRIPSILRGNGSKAVMGDSATDAGSKTSDSEQHLTNHGKGKGASSHQGSPEEAVFHSHQDRQRAVRSRRPTIDVSSLVDKMDIIDPEDITLIRFIGAGGFGDVYLGRWHSCEVAIKCINPSLLPHMPSTDRIAVGNNSDKNALHDLFQEADILGSLRHPCIVWTYGIVVSSRQTLQDDDMGFSVSPDNSSNLAQTVQEATVTTPFANATPGMIRTPALVVEYMAAGSLRSALSRKSDIVSGPLTRLILALDAAKGMDYLHKKSIVHFDLKSPNLLLGYRDRRPVCKVSDFGLARERANTFISGVNSQRGTLPWTAPEIIKTPEKVTEKVDVFSFAIVMWELWTSREPYEGLNYHGLLMKLADPSLKMRPPIPGTSEWAALEEDAAGGGKPTPPQELAPGYKELMERCWEEDPARRPPFHEIVMELKNMIAAVRSVRKAERMKRPSRT